MADVVGAADLDQGLASLPPRLGLLPLMKRELLLATEPNCLSSPAPLVGPALISSVSNATFICESCLFSPHSGIVC
jgi:hypothetical protein